MNEAKGESVGEVLVQTEKRVAIALGTSDTRAEGGQHLRKELERCSACFCRCDDFFLVLFSPERAVSVCMDCAMQAALRIFRGF
jgi:hypothetical protein